MKFESDVESRAATAVDFVAVKASRFKSFSKTRKNFANIVPGVLPRVTRKFLDFAYITAKMSARTSTVTLSLNSALTSIVPRSILQAVFYY
jgi:hypothetical protein